MRKLLVLIFPVMFLAACGVGPDKSREDATDTANVDKTAPLVIAFNNHYPNVETKCGGAGFRVFVTTKAYDRTIVLPDEHCR